jgi:hypothetical protein
MFRFDTFVMNCSVFVEGESEKCNECQYIVPINSIYSYFMYVYHIICLFQETSLTQNGTQFLTEESF